ncbi:hypothetical protein [Alteriqipengyuania lutimaris]|uniref:Uncharacterized protein n=1 Tax=Alteriqipengyuania lutimaris TaxID=1538146 RepID=A0A395LMJ4_9SPHN|nr:hypothetical protein [Alteriqipengyuania lutimaris]MBB3033064.1 hypothetical protein [Alteriqipengyuania lutimaris]RDS77869.1 hypothetical protein DL238_09825 [Alteriqipengyuania lutimaris]
MRTGLLIASAAMFAASTAGAQSLVAIDREVFLEVSQERDGRTQRLLAPAEMLERGDTVVLMLAWRSPRDAPFTISSRVPRNLAFRASGGATAQVSVDGGRTWGTLASLRVEGRPATSADVTNIRWDVANPRAAKGRGVFTYSAVVR